MIQDILTYLSIFAALAVIVYRTVRLFVPTKQNSGGDCCSSGGCHDCNLKEIDSGIQLSSGKTSENSGFFNDK